MNFDYTAWKPAVVMGALIVSLGILFSLVEGNDQRNLRETQLLHDGYKETCLKQGGLPRPGLKRGYTDPSRYGGCDFR